MITKYIESKSVYATHLPYEHGYVMLVAAIRRGWRKCT